MDITQQVALSGIILRNLAGVVEGAHLEHPLRR